MSLTMPMTQRLTVDLNRHKRGERVAYLTRLPPNLALEVRNRSLLHERLHHQLTICRLSPQIEISGGLAYDLFATVPH